VEWQYSTTRWCVPLKAGTSCLSGRSRSQTVYIYISYNKVASASLSSSQDYVMVNICIMAMYEYHFRCGLDQWIKCISSTTICLFNSLSVKLSIDVFRNRWLPSYRSWTVPRFTEIPIIYRNLPRTYRNHPCVWNNPLRSDIYTTYLGSYVVFKLKNTFWKL